MVVEEMKVGTGGEGVSSGRIKQELCAVVEARNTGTSQTSELAPPGSELR